MRATTINEMANIMGSRYFKVNLMSFQRHGTIEFRQHSGTVNATKIANWVRFLGQFIDNSKARNTPAVSAPVIEHPALHGVQARLSEMFTSQGVVSLSAMCDTFGWLPHTARAAVTRLRRMGMQIEPLRGQSAYRLVSGMMRTSAPALGPKASGRGSAKASCVTTAIVPQCWQPSHRGIMKFRTLDGEVLEADSFRHLARTALADKVHTGAHA